MHLVVSGASGFVASSLLPHLEICGHTGITSARRRVLRLPHGWSWRDRSGLIVSEGPTQTDAVVHLEVKQHVPNPSAEDLAEFKKVNVDGTQKWLNWASRNG